MERGRRLRAPGARARRLNESEPAGARAGRRPAGVGQRTAGRGSRIIGRSAHHRNQGRPMPAIEFTGNYQDLSTDKGYQFKFFCEKCGNGYMSSFKTSAMGMAASAVEVASSLFGGIF